MLNHVLSGLLGAVLGGALVYVVLPATTPVLPTPAPTTRTTQSPVSTPSTAAPSPGTSAPDANCPPVVRTELEALRKEVEVLRFQASLQEGELEQAGARELPWPDDAPTNLQHDAFAADIETVVEGLGDAEVASVDCQEYPCIAFVKAADEAAVDRYFDQGQERLDALGGYTTAVRTVQAKDGTWWAAFHATADGVVPVDDLAVNQRVEVRVFDFIGSR